MTATNTIDKHHGMTVVHSGGSSSNSKHFESKPKRAKRQRRRSEGLVMSFPDVSVKEALTFVRVGSKVQRMKRHGPRCNPCKWAHPKRAVESLSASVDNEKQALILENIQTGHITEVYLVNIQAVHPVAMHEMWALTPNDAMLDQFQVVTTKQANITLMAESRKHVKYWVTALQFRVNQLRRQDGRQIMTFVRTKFRMADTNGDGRLVLEEVAALFRAMNCFQGESHLQETFRKFDTDNSGGLNEDEFVGLFRAFLLKKPLRKYFELYSVLDEALQENVMSWERLCRFRKEVQGDDVHVDKVAKELQKFGEPLLTEGHDALTEFGFCAYMASQSNSVMKPERAYLYQDMTRPLSHYWISSSHNTYLENSQIAGTASVDQYLRVIRSGCRCVEIDCWDGPGEPIVTHGFTMTTKISFREVVTALRDHAFDNSPFPLILSLEMHCSEEQVGKIGQILESTFGDMILRHPPTGHGGELMVSPEMARKKVLIKGKIQNHSTKKLSEKFEDKLSMQSEPTVDDHHDHHDHPAPGQSASLSEIEDQVDVELPQRESSINMVLGERARTHTDSSAADTVSSMQVQQVSALRSSIQQHTITSSQINHMRSSLVRGTHTRTQSLARAIAEYNRSIYMISRKFQHLGDDAWQPCNIASFSETSHLKLIKRHGEDWAEHHQSHLSRIYPPGTYVNSENMLPMLHWSYGAQMVALNYQTMDTGMLLHEGMFREQNGGYGYVLKPSSLMGGKAAGEEASFVLTVTIVSGHFLPKPRGEEHLENINPLVVLSLYGKDGDVRRHETSCIAGNGFSPEWYEGFDFEIVQDDVAIITFEVFHKMVKRTAGNAGPRKLVACAAYPVRAVRSGLRWVSLWDMDRVDIPNCGLLVEVAISRSKADSAMQAFTSRTGSLAWSSSELLLGSAAGTLNHPTGETRPSGDCSMESSGSWPLTPPFKPSMASNPSGKSMGTQSAPGSPEVSPLREAAGSALANAASTPSGSCLSPPLLSDALDGLVLPPPIQMPDIILEGERPFGSFMCFPCADSCRPKESIRRAPQSEELAPRIGTADVLRRPRKSEDCKDILLSL